MTIKNKTHEMKEKKKQAEKKMPQEFGIPAQSLACGHAFGVA
jgi:hypothetical protein